MTAQIVSHLSRKPIWAATYRDGDFATRMFEHVSGQLWERVAEGKKRL